MRRSDIVSGIILILSISDFTLAAPLPVREKLHACVDVVHTGIHKENMMGKRGKEDLDKFAKLATDYFEKWGKPDWWSDAHASSSSAPPGPDQASTVDVKAPEPNPASPPANPYPLLESSVPPPNAHLMPGEEEDDELTESDYEWFASDSENELHPIASQTSTKFGPDHALTGEHVAQPKPNPGPSAGADPNFDWEYWRDLPSPPRKRPVFTKEFGQASGQRPDIGPSTFDWNYGTNLKDKPPPKRLKLVSLKELGQAHEDKVAHAQQSSLGPSTDNFDVNEFLAELISPGDQPPPMKQPGPELLSSSHEPDSPKEPKYEEPKYEENQVSSPASAATMPGSPELTDPELHSQHQPLSTDDFLAAIYGAKGKAKESRRIPGTARHVGNGTWVKT